MALDVYSDFGTCLHVCTFVYRVFHSDRTTFVQQVWQLKLHIYKNLHIRKFEGVEIFTFEKIFSTLDNN